MKVYLCDISALRFWREWSRLNPVSVREFHERTERATSDLPFRMFPCVPKIGPCAASPAAVRRVVALAPTASAEARIVARIVEDALGLSGDREPLHLIGPTKPGIHAGASIRYHHSAARYPRGSFLEVAPHLCVCSPELVFVQMASCLSFGELLALGYELCGAYPLVPPRAGLVRRPLCSASRLSSFVGQLQRTKGIGAARKAAPFVRSKSASFMESEVCASIALPRRHGGFNRSGVVLNRLTALSPRAAKVARRDDVAIDLLWPEVGIGMEYDGVASHSAERQMTWDSRKYDALALEDIELWRLTADQFANVLEFQEIVRRAFGKRGIYVRALKASEQSRCLALRAEMRKFHREHLFGDSPLSK